MTTPHLHRRVGYLVATALGALGGTGVGTAAADGPPTAWTVVVLNPGSAVFSYARDGAQGAGGQQVGYALLDEIELDGTEHAVLWHGTAASAVFLEPAGATESLALAVEGDRQYGQATFANRRHAGYWTGSAQSWVDLHPVGVTHSDIRAADGQVQGGAVSIGTSGSTPSHAALWRGTRESWVDLHPQGPTPPGPTPPGPFGSWVTAIDDAAGVQVGQAYINGTNQEPGRQWASLWRGSGASWVSLNLPGQRNAWATCAAGGRQGGFFYWGDINNISADHACIWSGTAESQVDLHPAGMGSSRVLGMNARYQVGDCRPPNPPGSTVQLGRACIWSGSAASMVDLSQFLPAGPMRASWSEATSVWSEGGRIYVVGHANATATQFPAEAHFQAVMWVSPFSACGPADFARQGGERSPDGVVDNNDVVVFIDLFFAHDAAADMGSQGGIPGADGLWNNNDFVAFIDAFFAGCG